MKPKTDFVDPRAPTLRFGGGTGPRDPDEEAGLRTIDFVRQAQQGRKSALDALFARYMPFVRRVVTIKSGARVRSRNEIDDLVQESLLAALKGFDHFEIRHESSFRGWIYKVVVRQVLRAAEHLDAQKNDPDRERSIDAGGAGGSTETLTRGMQLESDATLPPDKLGRKELQQALDECIATFPEPERTLLVLRLFVHGERAPWAEIGPEMGMTPDQARMRCNRALDELREQLRKRGFEGPGGKRS